jgi:hypothetical protein
MFKHADFLFALISGGLFLTSTIFGVLWVRARVGAGEPVEPAAAARARKHHATLSARHLGPGNDR